MKPLPPIPDGWRALRPEEVLRHWDHWAPQRVRPSEPGPRPRRWERILAVSVGRTAAQAGMEHGFIRRTTARYPVISPVPPEESPERFFPSAGWVCDWEPLPPL